MRSQGLALAVVQGGAVFERVRGAGGCREQHEQPGHFVLRRVGSVSTAVSQRAGGPGSACASSAQRCAARALDLARFWKFVELLASVL